MSVLTTILKLAPIIGSLAGTVIEKLWPDRSDARNKSHEERMAELNKFALPPRVLLKYLVILLFALIVVWAFAAALFGSLRMPPPEVWQSIGSLVDTLFEIGG